MIALPRSPLLLMATVSSALALSLSVVASQTPAPAQKETARISRALKLSAATIWTTTDIELQPGERAVFTATGTGRCGLESEFGPEGLPRGFRDLLRVLPVQSGRGALIGRVGDAEVGLPFAIGASGETVATGGGSSRSASIAPRTTRALPPLQSTSTCFRHAARRLRWWQSVSTP